MSLRTVPDRQPRPLFAVDAGWLYILAGLALISFSTVLPARRDLHDLRLQQAELQAKEQYAFERLAAYARFMDQWDRSDQDLLVRLASSQLNRRPEGDRPVVLASNASSAVTDWIEAAVDYDAPPPQHWPDSILSRLTASEGQLWLLAGGALAVFIGLVLTPSATTAGRLGNDAEATAVTVDDVFDRHGVDEDDHGHDGNPMGTDERDGAGNDVGDGGPVPDLETFGVEGNDQFTFWPEHTADATDEGACAADENGARPRGTSVDDIGSSRAAPEANNAPSMEQPGEEDHDQAVHATIDEPQAVEGAEETDAGDAEEPVAVGIAREGDDEDESWEDEDEDEDEDDQWDEEDDDEQWEDEDEDDEQWDDDEDDEYDDDEEPDEDDEDDEDDEYEEEEGDEEGWEEDEDDDDDLFADDDDEEELWEEEEDED